MIIKFWNSIKRDVFIFCVFGFVGVGIETVFRALTEGKLFGYSSWVMFFLFGLSGLLIGRLNETKIFKKINIHFQACIGVLIVYAVELVFGIPLNIYPLQLNLWSYLHLPLNVLGQITLCFAPLWYLASLAAIKIDDDLRH